MRDASEESSLVDQMYEAAVVPEHWHGVVSQLCALAGGQAALLSVVQSSAMTLIATTKQFADTWQDIFTRFPGASNQRTRRLLATRHAGFLTDTDVFGSAELRADPLYTEILLPRGYGSGVATAIHFPDGAAAVVNIEKSQASGPFGADIIGLLDGMRPHLARSALLSARLAFERARSAVRTLAAFGLPACAVRPSGAVILANDPFDGERSVWTTRRGERIALLDRRADALLGESLRQVGLGAGARSIPIRGGPDTGPSILHVIPVRRSAHDLFGQASAILVLSRPSASPTASTPLLQALFDLSPAEAAIAAQIAAGHTVERVALDGGKSLHTVRNQIKTVLAKTGCARQVDLARLLAQLLPAGP